MSDSDDGSHTPTFNTGNRNGQSSSPDSTPKSPILKSFKIPLTRASGSVEGCSSPPSNAMSPTFTPGGPMLSPGQQDPVHALPSELLAAGWRRFWSKREGRCYFYNKLTNESRWEMPGASGDQLLTPDPLTDPLGIQTPPIPKTPVVQPSLNIAHKRPSCDEPQHMPVFKKVAVDLSYSPYWNFEFPTNVTMFVRKPCPYPHPHPEIEAMRATLTSKLRLSYQEMCHHREGISAPPGSFNRWLLERKVNEAVEAFNSDPLLPSKCSGEVSPCLYRELMNDIPVRLQKVKYSRDARMQLFKYAEAAKRMIESRSTSSDSRKVVKWSADDTFAWLRKPSNASFEDYLERLAHIRRQCQPHVAEAARSSLEGICIKLYHMSQEASTRLFEKHWQLLKAMNIMPPCRPGAEPTTRKVLCYPVQLSTTTPQQLPSVDRIIDPNSSTVALKFQQETLKCSAAHFHKLEQLYKLSCNDDQMFSLFLARAWCLLRRYQTLFGIGSNEGQDTQAALPLPVFETLNRVFGVSFECFASPLNCYFKQFCSAFADTDGYFGSRGSILDFYPLSGSFEANPPFCEELMEAMVDHFENLLKETTEPLSFIVFIPDWRDPPTEALVRLESSPFNRKTLSIPAHEHEYRHGFQHLRKEEDINIKSSHGTLVVFLQNLPGFQKWGPTPERIKELLQAFHPKNKASPSTSHND